MFEMFYNRKNEWMNEYHSGLGCLLHLLTYEPSAGLPSWKFRKLRFIVPHKVTHLTLEVSGSNVFLQKVLTDLLIHFYRYPADRYLILGGSTTWWVHQDAMATKNFMAGSWNSDAEQHDELNSNSVDPKTQLNRHLLITKISLRKQVNPSAMSTMLMPKLLSGDIALNSNGQAREGQGGLPGRATCMLSKV